MGRPIARALLMWTMPRRGEAVRNHRRCECLGPVGGQQVVTGNLEPVGEFWEAESRTTQDYWKRYPMVTHAIFVRPNWKLPRVKTAA